MDDMHELSSSDGFRSIDAPSPRRRAPEPDDSDAIMQDGPISKLTGEEQAIPTKLVGRLLHEHFSHDDTRITKEAMSVFSKYIEVFAVEALYRANEERKEAAKEAAKIGQDMDEDYLEVRSLPLDARSVKCPV